MLIINFILFFFAIFLSFYLPGKLLLSPLSKQLNKFAGFFLPWPVGISIFLPACYLSAWIRLPYLPLFLLILLVIYSLIYKRQLFTISVPSIDKWTTFIILIGSMAFLSLTFFSGWQTKDGLQFIGVNGADGIMHIGFINNQLTNFPPMHISLAGFSLRGYHYFYDFLVSRFVLFYHFSVYDLHFRFIPLFISLLYGGAFYLFSTLFINNPLSRRFILFFLYFGQSWQLLLSLLTNSQVNLSIVQPLGLIFDPSIILSLAILMPALYLLLINNKAFYVAVLIGLLLGILSEIKVYSGVLGIGCLIIYIIYLIILKRKHLLYALTLLLVTIFTTIITYFPNNFGVGSLVLAPFLIYDHFMRDSSIDLIHWALREDIYSSHHNILRIIQMYTEAILIFWITNLGLRILLIIQTPFLFKRTTWQKESNIIIISLIGLAILIPSFFIQSFSVFNILQFIWILMPILSIPVGIVFANVFIRSNKFKYPLFSLIVIISLAGCVPILESYLIHPQPGLITNAQLKLFHTIQAIVPKTDYIAVLPPYNKDLKLHTYYLAWNGTPEIAAFSNRYTYFENEVLDYSPQLDQITTMRKNRIEELAKAVQVCNKQAIRQIIRKIGTPYIVTYLPYKCLRSMSADTTPDLPTTDLYFYNILD